MQTFGEKFGALIKDRRESQGMSLADVARLAFTKDGTGRDVDAEARKSDVKRLEDGLTAKPRYATIKAFQQALGITDAEVAALRTPSEQAGADRLTRIIAERDDLLHARNLSERQVIALAERITDSVTDYTSALAELENAVEIAQKVHRQGETPSNHPDFVDAVFAEVARLAEDGDLDAGATALEDALEANKAAEGRLLDALIDQHTLRRDVPATTTALLARFDLDLDHANDPDAFEKLRALQDHYYVLGRDKGLAFDLEVSIHLAQACETRAIAPEHRGAALNDLGNALATLGAREEGTARLEDAVTAYRAALEVRTREAIPVQWAMTQNNLGNALRTLGAREEGTARLEEAVTAYRSAHEVRTRDALPLDWAMTQGNIGFLQVALFDKTAEPAHLREGLIAVEGALEVFIAGGATQYIAIATRLRDDIQAILDTITKP